MAKYADWYAVELDGYLKGRISDVARFEATKEIANHFSENVDDLVAKGMDPIEAEKAAIKSFGHPRDAAINLLRQGPGSKIGGTLSTVGMLLVSALFIFMTITTQRSILKLPFPLLVLDSPSLIWRAAPFTLLVAVICMVLSAYLTRRVHFQKYFIGFALGLAISTGFLLMGPRYNYANVSPTEFPNAFSVWEKGHQATEKLALLESSIRSAVRTQRPYDAKPYNKQEALNLIQSATEKMVLVEPHDYIQTVGSLTKGYLIPNQASGEYQYDFNGRKLGPRSEVPASLLTHDSFPWNRMTLKYTSSAEEAISAWQTGRYPYYSGSESEFEMTSGSQRDFLVQGRVLSALSKGQLALEVLKMPFFGSLIYLAILLGASWIASKIALLSRRPSFKRLIA